MASPSDAPQFSLVNPDYEVYVKELGGTSNQQELVRQVCQGSGCVRRGAHSIMSYTMSSNGQGGYNEIEIRVRSVGYQTSDGNGWAIRPSYLQDQQIVKNVDDSFMASQGFLTFKVTQPCQLEVEIGSEEILFSTETLAWRFNAIFLALNPPESEFPNGVGKPTVQDNNGVLSCTSSDPSRSCIIGQNDSDCTNLEVPSNTDLYFTSQNQRYYLWGTADGCGTDIMKSITPLQGARVFLDQDVIVFARIGNTASNMGVYGYGILSNFYMYGTRGNLDPKIWGMIRVGSDSTIWGPVLMGSPYRNIRGDANCEVAWTKSFAWVAETDGVELSQSGGRVHDNLFKVNDDVLKAFQPNTIFERNVVWHQYTGRAFILSWGNAGENGADLDATVKVYDTTIIHDYAGWTDMATGTPQALYTQAQSVTFASIFAIHHSYNNAIGTPTSAVDIQRFRVEGKVGQLMVVSNGYSELRGKALWQDTNGCTGGVNVNIQGFDLRYVTGFRNKNVVGGCNVGDTEPSIQNGNCICQQGMGCAATDCSVTMSFSTVQNPTATTVPDFVDELYIGNNTAVTGIQPGINV